MPFLLCAWKSVIFLSHFAHLSLEPLLSPLFHRLFPIVVQHRILPAHFRCLILVYARFCDFFWLLDRFPMSETYMNVA